MANKKNSQKSLAKNLETEFLFSENEPILPATEQWEAPADTPPHILELMPDEKTLPEVWEAMGDRVFKGLTEAEFYLHMRGFYNFRRRETYHLWKTGFYEKHPEFLKGDWEED